MSTKNPTRRERLEARGYEPIGICVYIQQVDDRRFRIGHSVGLLYNIRHLDQPLLQLPVDDFLDAVRYSQQLRELFCSEGIELEPPCPSYS